MTDRSPEELVLKTRISDRDTYLRAPLIEFPRDHFKDSVDSWVIDEFPLGYTNVRADVIVMNMMMHGFEIKSAGYDYRRLPRQVKAYDSILNRNWIVGGRHCLTELTLAIDYIS